MRAVLVVSAFLLAGFVSDAFAKSNNFVVTRHTEHKIGEIYGIGGQRYCVWAYKLGTREPSRVGVRRSHNGNSKFLHKIRGKHCWKSKPGAYIVYAAAGDVNLRVYFEIPGHDPHGPRVPVYDSDWRRWRLSR